MLTQLVLRALDTTGFIIRHVPALEHVIKAGSVNQSSGTAGIRVVLVPHTVRSGLAGVTPPVKPVTWNTLLVTLHSATLTCVWLQLDVLVFRSKSLQY